MSGASKQTPPFHRTKPTEPRTRRFKDPSRLRPCTGDGTSTRAAPSPPAAWALQCTRARRPQSHWRASGNSRLGCPALAMVGHSAHVIVAGPGRRRALHPPVPQVRSVRAPSRRMRFTEALARRSPAPARPSNPAAARKPSRARRSPASSPAARRSRRKQRIAARGVCERHSASDSSAAHATPTAHHQSTAVRRTTAAQP